MALRDGLYYFSKAINTGKFPTWNSYSPSPKDNWCYATIESFGFPTCGLHDTIARLKDKNITPEARN